MKCKCGAFSSKNIESVEYEDEGKPSQKVTSSFTKTFKRAKDRSWDITESTYSMLISPHGRIYNMKFCDQCGEDLRKL